MPNNDEEETSQLLLNNTQHTNNLNQTSNQTSQENDNLVYNASSPDELALVNGARFLGVTYLGRDTSNNKIMKIKFKEEERQYELLNTIEFNSTRKRMTSIIRDIKNNQIIVMCKGADSVLLPLIKDNETPQVSQLIN